MLEGRENRQAAQYETKPNLDLNEPLRKRLVASQKATNPAELHECDDTRMAQYQGSAVRFPSSARH